MGSVLQGQKTGDEYILYLHDENGNAYGFLLKNGTTEAYYYYIFNAQGDVIGILDSTGTQVVAYEYSAWGEVLSVTGTLASTIGQSNPIRYRGYYYDSETGFYYCNSRYYDPETGRFINSDSQITLSLGLLGTNLFTYCLNNPIMYSDTQGLCAKAWADGYQGPCPGQGLPGCMDNRAEYQDDSSTNFVLSIDKNSPPDHPDYKPPKKGGDKKVKNPNGEGWGWRAKDGGVWVPDPKMHGGEGWTVQYPGGDHSHAYPGGGVRNHFQAEQSTGISVIKIFVGAIGTAGLFIDNLTGVGVADDMLIACTAGCFFSGLDGLYGKKVCTECGGVRYGY